MGRIGFGSQFVKRLYYLGNSLLSSKRLLNTGDVVKHHTTKKAKMILHNVYQDGSTEEPPSFLTENLELAVDETNAEHKAEMMTQGSPQALRWQIVETSPGVYGVFSRKKFVRHDLIIESKVLKEAPCRDKHSVQVDWDRHIYMTLPATLINHCCYPNMGLKTNEFGSYSFYAIKDIEEDEELTFDYQTCEFISISVPKAICGTNNPCCRGKSVGFKFLADELREQYGEYIAHYLNESEPRE